MLELTKLKQSLRGLVAEGKLEAAFLELAKYLTEDLPKHNLLLHFKARQSKVNEADQMNTLSNEALDLQRNELTKDFLDFISGLEAADFSKETAKKADMGSVLYRIPERMQHQQKSKCIVRVAYDEALLKETLAMTVDAVIEPLKVAKNMEVKLLDEEGDGDYFEITSRSTPEQFLDAEAFTEWTFFVKPLQVGNFTLALIITLIVFEDGKDRKRDISLTRSINVTSEPAPVEAGDHAFQKAGLLLAFTAKPLAGGGEGPKPKPWLKLVLGLLVAGALGLLAFWFLKKSDADSNTVAEQEKMEFEQAAAQNSPVPLIGFLAKYEGSPFEGQAREIIHQSLPAIDIDSAIQVVRQWEGIQPIQRSDGGPLSGNGPGGNGDPNESDPSPGQNAGPANEVQVAPPQGNDPGSGQPSTATQGGQGGPSNQVSGSQGNTDQPTTGGTKPNTTAPSSNPNTSGQVAPPQGTSGQGNTNKPTSGQGKPNQPTNNKPNTTKPTGTQGNATKPTNGGTTNTPPGGIPTNGGAIETALPKPGPVRWNDKVVAKEDPIKWLESTMVKVKGGSFKMGCSLKLESTGCAASAEPQHEVRLPDFHISRFEVTQALWAFVMGERKNPSRFDDCDLCPVEQVSWNEAQDFIKKLNRLTGREYRLPTEAEWEYAARQSGKENRFGDGTNTAMTTNFNFNSEDLPERRFVVKGESRLRTVDVFMLKANGLGLYHMSGNVAEWCEDRWHPDYEGAPADGSAWLDGSDNRRVIRGGGWDTEPYAARTYDRDAKKANTGDDEVGFRLVW